eukprot:3605020-Ditylum_brightwellii.AAC.2
MKQVNCEDERTVKKWKEQNNSTKEALNKIPKSALLQRMRCWGEAPKRIESWVVSIQSAAKDAITGEEAYKQLLRKHNEYLTSIIAIAIKGLHKGALW